MKNESPESSERNSKEIDIPAEMGVSEQDAIDTVGKHLDALTKLVAIALPLVVAVMVALATTNDAIDIFGTKYPRQYAELVARCIVTLIFAQCCLHLTVISSLLGPLGGSVKLKRALAWHPGLCNPFFVPPADHLGVPPQFRAFTGLLVGRWLTTQLAFGFTFGFAGGFRIDYSPGMLAHWYRLAGGFLYYFDSQRSSELFYHAQRFAERYVAAGPSTWRSFDTILALLHLFMFVGIAFSVTYIVSFVAERGRLIGYALMRLAAC